MKNLILFFVLISSFCNAQINIRTQAKIIGAVGPSVLTGVGTTITITQGTPLQALRLNAAGTAMEFYTPTSGGVTSIGTTSPITGGTITTTGTIGINNSAADGSTKGAAAFNSSDFNSSSGVITLDYTNGQASSGSVNGFLSSTDWTTFNNKGSGTVLSVSAGYGTTFTTITSTGSIVVDTSIVVNKTGIQLLTNKFMSGVSNTFSAIPNSALSNSTISGVALGGTLFALSAGYGITGSNFTGAGVQSWVVDSSVFVNKTGVQLLTNKFLSGSTNTFTNIGNAALTNSTVNYNGISCALGSSVTVGADVSLYMPAGRWFGTANTNYPTTNTVFAQDVVRFIPIIIGKAGTIALIGLNINVGGSAGCTFRLGIYAGDGSNGLPGTLLYDSGVLAGDVAADKTAVPSLVVTPGLYWLATNNNGTSGITFKSTTSSAGPIIVTGNSSLTAAPPNVYTRTLSYGALPNPAGAISTSTTAAQVPNIMIQF